MTYTKLVLLLISVSISLSSFSQEYRKIGFVNNLQLSKIDAEYLTLGKANNGNDIFTERAGIVISYGDTGNSGIVKDENGNPVRFKESMISILNFMAYNGWEYIGNANDLLDSKGRDLYLFRKKR